MPKTKYDHLSREELITVLVKRDAERKLGLVWERLPIVTLSSKEIISMPCAIWQRRTGAR